MKILFSFCLLLFSGKQCNNQTENYQEIDFVEYKAATRGSSFSCKIIGSQILVQSQGSETFEKIKKINTEQWQEIAASIDNLELKEIPSFKSSKNLRASDRSRVAQFIISIDQVLYESESFDEGTSFSRKRMGAPA